MSLIAARRAVYAWMTCFGLMLFGCSQPSAPLVTSAPTVVATLALVTPTVAPTSTAVVLPTRIAPTEVLSASYQVVNSYPHDRQAFTQGLVFYKGELYESTGLNGQSTVRRVELVTGKVLQRIDLPSQYFGEGLALLNDQLFQLTWQNNTGFVYDRATLKQLRTFEYPMQGWGITHDGQRLMISDGTATIRFYDPTTLTETGQIQVTQAGRPIVMLNELEYVGGEIYANIWQTNLIARIEPTTGHVVGWIDLSGLLKPEDMQQPVDVLNGIAYDAEADRLFVTGKLWPKLFEIKVK